jgi:hypothetical protein
VRGRVPRSNWETLSPIVIESLLRTEYPEKGDFLGCGLIYEGLMSLDRQSLGMVCGKPRNPGWEKASKDYLYGKVCYACGGKFRLVTHHKIPFHDNPDLEMVESNWIPLCEGRYSCNCHLTFGHMGNWTLFNPKVVEMAAEYLMQWNLARNK